MGKYIEKLILLPGMTIRGTSDIIPNTIKHNSNIKISLDHQENDMCFAIGTI